MNHRHSSKIHATLSTVLAAASFAASAIAADTTQTLNMFLNTREAPPCASAGTGITTVTLIVNGIPDNHTVTLTVNRFDTPPASDSGPIGARLAAANTQTFTYTADSAHYYTFAVVDKPNDPKGPAKPIAIRWKCGFDDTLSLSIGTLFTGIPYRTYGQQQVPTANGVQNLMVVSDTGRWARQGAGLLNYKRFNFDQGIQLGGSLSSGPVFKFGGTPGISNFGWFAGTSVSIWRRLFITPGLHIGEFADYPAGFGNYTPTLRQLRRSHAGEAVDGALWLFHHLPHELDRQVDRQ